MPDNIPYGGECDDGSCTNCDEGVCDLYPGHCVYNEREEDHEDENPDDP